MQAEFLPVPFLSATMDDCVANAKDLTSGGAEINPAGVCLTGIANVADSLAAIKKLVFEERRVSMPELIDALKNDFTNVTSSHHALRQMLLNRAPKYGNGDAYVDDIAREVQLHYTRELGQYRNAFGGRFLPLIFTTNVAQVRQFGPRTGALPDGRKAKTPLANSLSPSQGRDISGPIAAMQSVTKLDHSEIPGGTSYILELYPSVIQGEDATEKLVSLLRTYFDLGGMNIAINIIDAQTLRAAQAEPNRHCSLSVRLFGYSDYFVNLDKPLQDFLIQKAERGI
jgi:formate C-acetyltransferase